MKYWIIHIALFIGSAVGLKAQPELPTQVKLVTEGDYIRYQTVAREGIDWLLSSPLDSNMTSRSEVNAFCLEWLAGHPDLRVEVYSTLMPYATEFPELMHIHILAAGRFLMENPDAQLLDVNLAGVAAVCEQVKKNKGPIESESLKSILSSQREGQLRDWVRSRMP